ncbi:hypothetical protein GCM10007094_33930 [Pseudovibrio japonicus]|uniref:Autotransporter domain-containing protein n=1 Tax=Pseudovibrio japonicus TaxID=366534 RepID=A0ABQ3EJ46_9HYPH|nr:autotransporter outer membrane beta-barrel domain-containing protein [Pseudovibrio japonicus]GHB41677.1 hypothetical protein GCM10007094_33930 [Pseudovibrio japonicus]
MRKRPNYRRIAPFTAGLLASTIIAVSFSGSAVAQIVINAPQNTPVTLLADGTVLVTDTGSIDVNPGFFAISSNGFNSEITLNGPVSGTINSPGNVDSLNVIFQNGDTSNTLIVRQGGDITATDVGAAQFARGVFQDHPDATHMVDLENAQITVTAPNASVAVGIAQRSNAQSTTVRFGANGEVSVSGGIDGAAGIVQFSQGNSTTATFGTGTHIEVESSGNSTGIGQTVSFGGDATVVFEGDARIDVRSTSAIFLVSTAISQITTSGSASAILGSDVHITSSGNAIAEGVSQLSFDNSFELGERSTITVTATGDGVGVEQFDVFFPGTDSTSVLHANSSISVTAGDEATGIYSEANNGSSNITLYEGVSITATGDSTTRGIVQTSTDSDNTITLENATISAISNSSSVRAIDQSTDVGNNTLDVGSNAQISAQGDGPVAYGIDQFTIQGDINNTFGSGNQITAEGNNVTAAINQRVGDSGDITNVFGDNTRIEATGNLTVTGVSQRTSSGFVSTTFGNDTTLNISLSNRAIGVIQDSQDNSFVLGENSTIHVQANSRANGLLQGSAFVSNDGNSALIHDNSHINIIAGDIALGIEQEADTGTNIIKLGADGSITITSDIDANGIIQTNIDGDNTVEAGENWDLSIDVGRFGWGIIQETSNGDNTLDIGPNGTLSITSLDSSATGVRQSNTLGDNTLRIGENANLTITTNGDGIGLVELLFQITTEGNNSIEIGDGDPMTIIADANAIAITQINTLGDNSVWIGVDEEISITAGGFGVGVGQFNFDGDNSVWIGQGLKMTIDAGDFARGLSQENVNGSNSIEIGDHGNLSISAVEDAFGINQITETGDNSTWLGTDLEMTVDAGGTANGIFQQSLDGDSTLEIGPNGTLSVTSELGAFGLFQRNFNSDNTIQIGENGSLTITGQGGAGITQLTNAGSNSMLIGAGGHISITSAGSANAVNQSLFVGDNTLEIGANGTWTVSAGITVFGIGQSAREEGDNTLLIGENGTFTVTTEGLVATGLAQSATEGDNLLEIEANGSLTVEAGGEARGIRQLNRNGDNTLLIGENGILTVTAGEDAFGIVQQTNIGNNTLLIGANDPLTVTAGGVAIGIEQVTDLGTNSIWIGAGERISVTAGLDGTGIDQTNIDGDNILEIGDHGKLEVVSGGIFTFGIDQSTNTGANAIQIGENGSIIVDGSFSVTGIRQSTFGSEDVTLTIGRGAWIDVTSSIAEVAGIFQGTTDGAASLSIGSGSMMNISGVTAARAVFQRASQNNLTIGANSTVHVVSETGLGFAVDQGSVSGSNRATIGANSRINVKAATTARGISSSASIGSAFITVEQGAEIYASGDLAQGVFVNADNSELLSSGRIIATSTNATTQSFGVQMIGDHNNFVNYGSVFADLAPDSHAIMMNGNHNSLSLLAYPVIQGQITFGDGAGTFGTDNTLTIGSGFDAAFTIDADPHELTVLGQGQPLAVNQIAPYQVKVVTLDSDGFFRASSVRMTDDLIRYLQQEIYTRELKNRQFLYQDNGLIQDFWFDASGFGQASTTGRAYSHFLGAFTIGYDRAFEDNALGGIYAGYSIGAVNAGNRNWDNTLQTAYAGIYYDRVFNRILTGINLLGGINWDDVSRTYLDNTAPGGVVKGDDNGVGFLISPELTIGYEVPWRQYLIVPSAGVRYSLFHQDSYSESGVNGLRLDSRNHQQINVRLQLAGIGFNALNQDSNYWNTTLRAGLDIYGNWGDDIDASVMGFDVPYNENLNDGGVRPFVGADVAYEVTDRATLDFGVEGAYDSIDAVFGSINAGFSVLF